jgi:hypothetical protein
MESFDQSGDGTLILDDFVTVDQLRNKLDSIAREEKGAAMELTKQAKVEEEALQLLTAQMDMINDKEPTMPERFLSIIPYLFPLLDSLQYARFLVQGNAENPIAIGAAVLYGLYRSIPLGGFIAFFALSFLSGNPSINRLIRYNMQQAIYVDIALIFPSLIAGLVALVANGQIPEGVTALGSDAIVLSIFAVCAYASVSSLLGVEPNKIPFISEAVNARMPSIEMFDQEGRFTGKKNDEDKKD